MVNSLAYLSSVQITGITGEMDTTMDTEYSVLSVSLFVAIEIVLIIGLLIHVFIIAVNVIDWRKGRTMTTSDQVILSIIISKLTLQFFIQINVLLVLFYEGYSVTFFILHHTLFSSNVFSSIWLSTLHSIVLYLKISILHNVIFLWLKKTITKNILSLIIVTVLVSTGYSLVNSLIIHFSFSQNSTQEYIFNNRDVDQAMSSLYLISNILPFSLCLLSSLLLIISLGFHISRMRYTQNSASSLDAYYRIIKYTIVSLLTCALYIFFNIEQEFIDTLSFELFYLLWITCTTLHSMYVIYVTTTLKKQFSRVFNHLTNCLLKRKEPNASDQIETVTG